MTTYTHTELNTFKVNELRTILKNYKAQGYNTVALNNKKAILIECIEYCQENDLPLSASLPTERSIERVGSDVMEKMQQRILELESIVYDKDRRIDELEEVMFTPSAVNKDAIEIEELHNHIDDITKDNQALREDLDRLHKINKEHQETIENLAQEIQELQEINEDLVDERDHAEREATSMSEEQADWEQQLELANQKIANLNSVIQKLEHNTNPKSNQTIKELQLQIQTLQEQRDDAKALLINYKRTNGLRLKKSRVRLTPRGFGQR